MAELKNVIEHLQIIRTWAELDGKMERGMEPKCCLRIAEWVDEALEMLKEQEPVKPTVKIVSADYTYGTEYACPNCSGSFFHQKVSYCPWCGRPVKWND